MFVFYRLDFAGVTGADSYILFVGHLVLFWCVLHALSVYTVPVWCYTTALLQLVRE
jgi:hypothetical protein